MHELKPQIQDIWIQILGVIFLNIPVIISLIHVYLGISNLVILKIGSD